MPRKPAQESGEALKAIQDHAFGLFGRYGYEGVSVGDIARDTGLSKGALYWHYRGKEALFLDCLKRVHALFDELIFEPMRAQTEALPKILIMFRGLEKLVQDARVVQGIGGYWLIPSKPETAALVAAQKAFEARARQTIEQTLKLGVEQGHFDYKGDLEDMALAIISIVEAVILPMRHLGPAEVHRILGVLARALFRAYAKPEDLEKVERFLG